MKRTLAMSACGLLAACALPAFAQVQRSGSDANAAAARVMLQLQQAQADRDKALAENRKLQQENDDLKSQLKSASAQRDALRRQGVAAASAQLAQKSAEDAAATDKLRGQMQELVTRYRETAQNLKDVETERTAKAESLAQRESDLKSCVDHNAKLYALNEEVLDKFENQGFWSALAAREPFTRLKRTELENLADGYRDTASDNRLPDTPRP